MRQVGQAEAEAEPNRLRDDIHSRERCSVKEKIFFLIAGSCNLPEQTGN